MARCTNFHTKGKQLPSYTRESYIYSYTCMKVKKTKLTNFCTVYVQTYKKFASQIQVYTQVYCFFSVKSKGPLVVTSSQYLFVLIESSIVLCGRLLTWVYSTECLCYLPLPLFYCNKHWPCNERNIHEKQWTYSRVHSLTNELILLDIA